jgi:hypothetical protein
MDVSRLHGMLHATKAQKAKVVTGPRNQHLQVSLIPHWFKENQTLIILPPRTEEQGGV